MLELKNICKTYRPKNGQPVQALKSVSVKFGETGLVFILGKSGCGKSTMLNCIGGLDKFDSGELVIKGKSSKEFTGSDFDSYRNTFIGFIFQEYNILSEFNIEKNIALALELQGKKATKEEVQRILEMVDLGEHAKRKTTELSGGQKQRVAIARALIKDPEIIIADEPTGALDSATGIQVFDTLKKLSEDKLVIVVSHDREFAEVYGDRIIEMKDGVIISDETKRKIAAKEVGDGLDIVGGDTIFIEKNKKLTEKQKESIFKYIEAKGSEVLISCNEANNTKFKKIAKIDDNNNTERFTATTEEDKGTQKYDKKQLKLIKSRLKQKDSFKMGASGLKSKPIRLAFTIILSVVAFTMFGLVDALSSYDRVATTVKSIQDGNMQSLVFAGEKQHTNTWINENGKEDSNVYYNESFLRESDVVNIEKETGLDFSGVYTTESNVYSDGMSLGGFKDTSIDMNQSYLTGTVRGFVNLTKTQVKNLGFEVVGNFPENSGEIMITEYIYRHYKLAGYSQGGKEIEARALTMSDSEETGIIGKKITVGRQEYKVVGVVDTKFDYQRFESLDPAKAQTGSNQVYSMVASLKMDELSKVVKYGYHALAIMSKDYLDEIKIKEKEFVILKYTDGRFNYPETLHFFNSLEYNKIDTDTNLVYMYEGYDINNLGANDVIVDISMLQRLNSNMMQNKAPSVYNALLQNGVILSDKVNESQIQTQLAQIQQNKDWFFSGDLLNLAIRTRKNDNHSAPENAFTKVNIVGFSIAKDVEYSGQNTVPIGLSKKLLNSLSSSEYIAAIAPMPTDKAELTKIVEYFYKSQDDETQEYRYLIANEITFTILSINSLLEELSEVFLYVGLGFCIFAALMLMNFIATSITYKKREIGILRAIGARKKDVFSIFYNESLIIAGINFVLSAIACGVVVAIINSTLRTDLGLFITLLNFSIRQVVLLAGVSVIVAFISSFLPVMKIAKKQPIDAINNR